MPCLNPHNVVGVGVEIGLTAAEDVPADLRFVDDVGLSGTGAFNDELQESLELRRFGELRAGENSRDERVLVLGRQTWRSTPAPLEVVDFTGTRLLTLP